MLKWPDFTLPPLNLHNCWQRNAYILRDDAAFAAREPEKYDGNKPWNAVRRSHHGGVAVASMEGFRPRDR